MKKLKVHGTKPKGHPFPIISWGIRLVEWSDISHVSIELEDGRIYHAHFNDVRFENRKEWQENVEILHSYEFKIPEEMYNAMIEWCENYKGKKKGYFKKLFGVLIPQVVRGLFKKFIKNTFASGMEDNALCSELVRFLALRFWSFKIPDFPYAENFTTQDVLQLMEDNNILKYR